MKEDTLDIVATANCQVNEEDLATRGEVAVHSDLALPPRRVEAYRDGDGVIHIRQKEG